MYESPIKLYEQQYYEQINEQLEDIVLSAVHKVHIDVDKEELIKVLEYDRGQYEKGYQDAMESIVKCKDCKYADNSCAYGLVCSSVLGRIGSFVAESDFCSCGERGNNGTD